MDIRDFLVKAVPTHPRDLVQYVAGHFKITPQAVHKHLGELIKDGLIQKTGETRNTNYSLSLLGNLKVFPSQKNLGTYMTDQVREIEEDVVWNDYFKPDFIGFPKNIIKICQYGFTEILNNARDHSGAKNVWASARLEGTKISIWIHDDGIGIFQKIKEALKLGTERESILHLSKGKFTTDPDHHTGEGIFFSSKALDNFYISTPNLSFLCSKDGEWLFDKESSGRVRAGTWICMEIDLFSKTDLSEVFARYTVDSEVPVFEKTHVVVKLGLLDEESFVSRSQAKRILLGLERFKEVLLDFREISEIGPSFADEIFRVFQLQHSQINLVPINVEPNVDAIIKRAKVNLGISLTNKEN